MKRKRIGAFLILFGIFTPTFLYPFTSLDVSALLGEFTGRYRHNFRDLSIILKQGDYVEEIDFSKNPSRPKRVLKGRIEIPYKYVLAGGVVLVFAGIITYLPVVFGLGKRFH